jgi:hypothetical protein
VPPSPLGFTIPPRWLELARQHPALWMVGAPVLVALLMISVALLLQPPRHAPPPEVLAASASPVAPAPAPAPAPPAVEAAKEEKPSSSALAALEGKAPGALSVEDVLLLNAGRAEHKREDVQALAHKLQEQPDLAQQPAVQAQLLRFAGDPDTAATALAVMARAPSPIGPDLLYEVWTSRILSPGTGELARSLLYSQEVRRGASPALEVALQLNGASCEAIQAALPKARSDGDRRSLVPLAKVNLRRGCGPKKTGDCYACLRSQTKQVLATMEAVKRRRAPSYSAHFHE